MKKTRRIRRPVAESLRYAAHVIENDYKRGNLLNLHELRVLTVGELRDELSAAYVAGTQRQFR